MDSQGCVREGLHYASGERIKLAWNHDGRVDSLLAGEGEGAVWIAPGLIDLQINGGYGYDFNSLSLTTDTVIQATRRLWEKGVTLYYPTVITNGDDEIEHILRVIDAACREDERVGSTIGGVHVEGPFISSEEGPRGAHDSRFIKAPDWELFTRWQAASGNRIRILTLSPEWPEAAGFIRKCAGAGIIVSIGHTAATPAQIVEAVAAGATMSTHLGNGAHLTLPRHPNYIWEQLAQDQLWAGMIADGYHLPFSVLKVFLRAKSTKALLVSDAVYLSGMPPGEYKTHIGGDVVLTPEGRLHLARKPELLAGSAMMLLDAVRRLADSGLCSFAEAWDMASTLPAQAMGLADHYGLKRGARADFVLLEKSEGSLRVLETVQGGRSVYRADGW